MTSKNDIEATGVVLHLTDGDAAKQENVLRNIMNLLDEIEAGTQVELVVHGPGISAITEGSSMAETLTNLITSGTRISACANTLRAKSLSQTQLVKGVEVVPSGIAQLVKRQWQGWAYVRP